MRAVLVVLAFAVALPTVAACVSAPTRFEDVEWTARGIYWIQDWELLRDDGARLARTFPTSVFHASSDGERVYFRRSVSAPGDGSRDLCDYVPTEDVRWSEEGVVDSWGTPLAVDRANWRAVSARGGNVTLHEMESGATVSGLALPAGVSVRAAEWSRDGSVLLLLTDADARPFDVATLTPLGVTPIGSGARASFSPTPDRFALAWRAPTGGTELRIVRADEGGIRIEARAEDARPLEAVAWSPDGELVAVTFEEAADDARGPRASVVILDGSLRIVGETSYADSLIGRGLAWSPTGDALAFGVGERLVVLPREGDLWGPRVVDADVAPSPTRSDPPRPVPSPSWVPALALAGAALLCRRRG